MPHFLPCNTHGEGVAIGDVQDVSGTRALFIVFSVIFGRDVVRFRGFGVSDTEDFAVELHGMSGFQRMEG